MNTRQEAYLIYQYLIQTKEPNSKIHSSELSIIIESILGTYDKRQKKQIIRCMCVEKWLNMKNGSNWLDADFEIIPNGKLLTPNQKLKLMLGEKP